MSAICPLSDAKRTLAAGHVESLSLARRLFSGRPGHFVEGLTLSADFL